MIVRAEHAADCEAIRDVNARAFDRDNEGRLVDALRASAHFIPELSLVAVDEGRVVGHILFSRIHIRTADRVVPALALAPMAVLPEHQHRASAPPSFATGWKRVGFWDITSSLWSVTPTTTHDSDSRPRVPGVWRRRFQTQYSWCKS